MDKQKLNKTKIEISCEICYRNLNINYNYDYNLKCKHNIHKSCLYKYVLFQVKSSNLVFNYYYILISF